MAPTETLMFKAASRPEAGGTRLTGIVGPFNIEAVGATGPLTPLRAW